MSVSLELANDLGELRRASVWLDVEARALGASESLRGDLDLCLNEALANIISYAYEDGTEHRIWLRLSGAGESLSLEIEDDGRAFNPFDVPAPPKAGSLEQLSVGGLGVHLIRGLMPGARYERRGTRNHLTLTAHAATAR